MQSILRSAKKQYAAPSLVDYGDIAAVTGILGGAFTGDVLVDTNGNVEQASNQSLDACPTRNRIHCDINP